MGNTIKLVSGFILFVIGILIAYETAAYNLVGLLLIVGLVISIVGIVLLVSYFIEYNADRTTNMIKDFLSSNEDNSSSFGRSERKSNSNVRSLRAQNEFNDYGDEDYHDLLLDDYEELERDPFFRDDYEEDNSKAVLNVAPRGEVNEADFDRELSFTPRYAKPLKVTRAPKRRRDDYFDEEEVPPFVVENDKSENIIRVLSQEEEPVIVEEPPVEVIAPAPEVAEPREIRIDVNNPESLPIPKLLKSYVISDQGLVTSQEAFDQLAVNVNKEIMLEIPSLNDLSDRFLSHVPTIYSRVIIDEFDLSDMSYMFLISSLIKQGVHIKTVPKVHTVNLITDDSHAMIISESRDDFEYGAIYDDRSSISNIRADFEKTWSLASNLDESVIISAMGG